MEEIIYLIQSLFTDHTLRIVSIGSILIGITAGALGSFLILRRQSLLADSVSHSVLPGVILAFMIFQEKNPLVLLTGALIMGWLSTLLMMWITKNSKIKNDTALAITLSVFFSLGIILLVIVQRIGIRSKAGLKDYIFGKAAGMRINDVYSIAIFGGIAILLLILFWKEFKLLAFNREFGEANGFPMGFLDILLTTTIVISIVVGLQVMGVILMSALLIGPAVASRQWTNRLGTMVVLSSIFGSISGLSGALISHVENHFPTGPFITLVISSIVIISVLFAPKRGLISRLMVKFRNKRKFKQDTLLYHLYSHRDRVSNFHYPIDYLEKVDKISNKKIMSNMSLKGYLVEDSSGFTLTSKGIDKAKEIIKDTLTKDTYIKDDKYVRD